jgi:hypothetical protein
VFFHYQDTDQEKNMHNILKRGIGLLLGVAIVAGILTASGAQAQEPELRHGGLMPAVVEAPDATRKFINYQGQLFNPGAGSIPIGNTAYQFRFTLYRDENGTNTIWSEPQSITTNPDGTFNALLGSVVELTDSMFTGDEMFLGVAINGQEARPLQIISYVPYAWWSRNADQLSGFGASDFTKALAFGFIDGNCNRVSGTGGWRSYRDLVAGAFVCIVDFDGLDYNHRSYSSVVTPSCNSPVFVGTGSSQGDMIIDIWDRFGNRSQCDASFAVFVP